MPPTDASAEAGTEPSAGVGSDGEDTVDLRLPEGFATLMAPDDQGPVPDPGPGPGVATPGPAHTPPWLGDDLLDRVADWGPASRTRESSTWFPSVSNGTCPSWPAG